MKAKRMRSAERAWHELVGVMSDERWSMVKLRGLGPYTIDRVEGTAQIEFSRTGKALPFCEWKTVTVRAYDLRLPDGRTRRFMRLIDAKAYVRLLLEYKARGDFAGCHPHSAAYETLLQGFKGGAA
jgi:hypothetical protein